MSAGLPTTFGIWDEVGEVYQRNAATLGSATGILVIIDLAMNLLASGHLVNTIGNIVRLIAMFLIMLTVLRAERLIEHEGRVPGYFLATLLSGLGIVLGFIALIVPGFYLLARWSLAQPLTITRNLGAIEAMRESWRETQDNVWTLVGVFVVFGLVAGVILVGTAFLASKVFGNPDALPAIGLLSVVTNAILVVSVCLTVAIYRSIIGSGVREAATFQ